MSRSNTTKTARRLEKLYDTKAHGTKHSTVMSLLRDKGLEGTMVQLEAWGMKPLHAALLDGPTKGAK